MLRRGFIFLFSLFFLTSCKNLGFFAPSPVEQVTVSIQSQSRVLGAFSKITMEGALDVALETGEKIPKVVLRGDPRDLAQVQTLVKGDTLYLALGQGYPHFGRVQAIVKTKSFDGLQTQGPGSLIGTDLKTGPLVLQLNSSGKIKLSGQIDLRQLTATGNTQLEIENIRTRDLRVKLSGHAKVTLHGVMHLKDLHLSEQAWLSLYWLDTTNLKLDLSDQAYLQIAGQAKLLDGQIWDKAQMNAQYLRVLDLYLKTHDASIAKISTLRREHVVAADRSDIYFYHLPTLRSNHMVGEGSVLDMRDFSNPDVQDYTSLNK